ncbi:MAG: HAD family hydrolase [Halorientalis sp.]
MLVAFDFSDTLARTDPFVRLGEPQGESEEVAALLDRMATGDAAFGAGLESVADRLAGLPVEAADRALEAVRLNPAASDLLGALHRADHDVAVVTDAPERAVRSCEDPATFDPDHVVANRLPTANGALTGDIEGPLVGRDKAAVLEELATARGHSLAETVAVGRDRRDLPMLEAAGTGVGVDPTPVVAAECDRALPSLERARDWAAETNLAP